MLNPFKWLYLIPPLEKQSDLVRGMRYLLPENVQRDSSEAYIYCKVTALTTLLAVLLVCAYWTSYLLETDVSLGLINIDYDAEAPVDAFLFEFPRAAVPLIVAFAAIYSISFWALRTDYLSKSGLSRPDAHQRYHGKGKRNPLLYILVACFSGIAPMFLAQIPLYFRSHIMYAEVHDFHAQTSGNLFLFSAIYIAICHLVIPLGVSLGLLNAIRSFLHDFYNPNRR